MTSKSWPIIIKKMPVTFHSGPISAQPTPPAFKEYARLSSHNFLYLPIFNQITVSFTSMTVFSNKNRWRDWLLMHFCDCWASEMVNIMWWIKDSSNVDLDPLPTNHRPPFPWRHRANVNKPKFECWWAPWVRFSTFFTWFPPPTCPRRHERQEIYLRAVQSHEIGEWAAEK